MSQRGGTFEISQDGLIISTITAPNIGGGVFGYSVFATGLDTTTTHEYKVAVRREGAYNFTPIFLMLSGAGAALQSHTYLPVTTLAAIVVASDPPGVVTSPVNAGNLSGGIVPAVRSSALPLNAIGASPGIIPDSGLQKGLAEFFPSPF